MHANICAFVRMYVCKYVQGSVIVCLCVCEFVNVYIVPLFMFVSVNVFILYVCLNICIYNYLNWYV